MTTISETFQKQVRSTAGSSIWLGAALIAVGVAALVWPVFSTLAATVFAGTILLVTGVLGVLGAFSIRGAGPFFGALLFSLLSVAAGVYMLAKPAIGEEAITLTLGVLFFQGAFDGVMTYELRRPRRRPGPARHIGNRMRLLGGKIYRRSRGALQDNAWFGWDDYLYPYEYVPAAYA
jgi:uncharacterized membrane protein HdeD (DUF308 family)